MSCLERFRVPLPAPVLTHRLACLALMLLTGAAAVLLSDAVVFRTLNVRDFVLAGLCAVLVFGCKAPYREIRR